MCLECVAFGCGEQQGCQQRCTESCICIRGLVRIEDLGLGNSDLETLNVCKGMVFWCGISGAKS